MAYLIIAVTVAIVVSLLAAPVFSVSSNQCSSCHGSTYKMQLDILEGNTQNNIPTTIQVGQTVTVAVVVGNVNNAPRYNEFSSVTLTLSSQNGHFSVSKSTFNIGTLPTGTATANWQIMGISQGQDTLQISASATNMHEYLLFSDSYSPGPSITVTPNPDPNFTPPPTPVPTPTPLPPTITVSPLPTANPTVAKTPAPIQTTTPNTNGTETPTPSPNKSPSTISSPQTTQNSKTQQNPTPTTHSLNSSMLYIHPPLAIIGYILIFLFAILALTKKHLSKIAKVSGLGLWVFTLLGLLTGVFWAQLAWGSYWSWDPKETLTLALFLTASVGQVAFFQKKFATAKWVAVLCCALVVITGLSSFIITGLHSYL
jgi:hypothetical protein